MYAFICRRVCMYCVHIYVCGCAAPTRLPTGTPAPTDVGDTNSPTRTPTTGKTTSALMLRE